MGRAAAVVGGSLVLGGLPAAARADAPARKPSAGPDRGLSPSRGRHVRRAVAAYDGLRRHFRVPKTGLYAPNFPVQPEDNPYAYVYPYSGVLTAALGLLRLDRRYAPDVRDQAGSLAAYYDPSPASANPPSPPARPSPPGYASYVLPPLGDGGDLFYDDNEWLGLAALQQYRTTGDRAALKRAELVFALVEYGWDGDPGHPDPGGTYWTQATYNHDRNTVSNALGAEIGTRLHLLTGNRSHLRHSVRMFDWVDRHLRGPNGLYWDHVDLEGTVDKAQLAYNQGNMLGAAALLHLATGERGYLRQAIGIAGTALDFYGSGESFVNDVPGAVVFFKNLLFLHSIRPDDRYRREQRKYADLLWENVDEATGLLTTRNPLAVNAQAALVEMQTLAAWSPRDYHLLL